MHSEEEEMTEPGDTLHPHQERQSGAIASFALQGLLTLTVVPQGADQKEPKVVLEASQPFFRFSRDQVRQLHQMLCDIHIPRPAHRSEDEDTNIYDLAEASLHGKVRFVYRSPYLQHPALLGLTALVLELSSDELVVLEMEVLDLVYDMNCVDAVCFYARSPSSQERVRHLLFLEQHGKYRDPALCGLYPYPMLPRLGWYLFPCLDQPVSTEQRPVCPECLRLWQALK
jgi:hypothetical protein